MNDCVTGPNPEADQSISHSLTWLPLLYYLFTVSQVPAFEELSPPRFGFHAYCVT